MIKGIVNGYYRTGSTWIYKIINNSNQNKIIILYEPFHPDLFLKLLKKEYIDPLHGFDTFSDYFKLSKKILKKIRKKYSKIRFNYFYYDNKVQNFLDILNEIKKEIMLQTNRAHFLLDKIKERYSCRAIHLIRNPIDEWKSFNNPTFFGKKHEKENLFLNRLKKFLNMFFKVRNFDDLGFVINYLSFKIRYLGKAKLFWLNIEHEKIKEKFNENPKVRDDYDKFIYNWTKINKHAIEAVGKSNVFWYEDLVNNPNKILEIGEKLGVNIDLSKVRVIKREIKFNKEEIKDFWLRAKKLGLEEDVRFILNTNKKLKKYLVKMFSA